MRFAYNQSTDKVIYEGSDSPETIRTTFAYDDYGNVLEQKAYGALSIAGDEAFILTEYINDADLWLTGFPKRQYVTDKDGAKFSETLSYYDGEDFVGLASGSIARGNLTRQEGWVEGGTYVNLVRNAYDAYGNITAIQDPNGYVRNIDYDSTLYLFPVSETIEIGGGKPDLTVTAAYNLGLGVVASSTDFNGHQTEYGYDTFGRLTSIVRPGDSTAFPTLLFSYTMADPENALVYEYNADGVLDLKTGPSVPSSVQTRAREVSGQSGTFDTIHYVEGLGRKLASFEEDEQGFVVKEAVLFNAAGTVRSTFLPYRTTSASYAPPARQPGSRNQLRCGGPGDLAHQPARCQRRRNKCSYRALASP